MMKNPDLRRYIRHGTLVQLSVFEAVARLGSFTRAGQELHMAQPTVSTHIRKLSDAIGLPLIESQGRALRITGAGRELLTACQEIFQLIVDVETRISALRQSDRQTVRLAVSTTAKYFAPRLLAHFWDTNPGVEVALLPMNRHQLLMRLEADLDDFYVISEPPPREDLDVIRLLPNCIGIYARADHPLAERKGIELQALRDEPFVLREPDSGTRLTASTAFAQLGFVPKVRMELSSNEAIKQAVLSGIGVTALSSLAVEGEVARGTLVLLDVTGFPIAKYWSLVHRKGRELSGTALRFLEHAASPQAIRELTG